MIHAKRHYHKYCLIIIIISLYYITRDQHVTLYYIMRIITMLSCFVTRSKWLIRHGRTTFVLSSKRQSSSQSQHRSGCYRPCALCYDHVAVCALKIEINVFLFFSTFFSYKQRSKVKRCGVNVGHLEGKKDEKVINKNCTWLPNFGRSCIFNRVRIIIIARRLTAEMSISLYLHTVFKVPDFNVTTFYSNNI